MLSTYFLLISWEFLFCNDIDKILVVKLIEEIFEVKYEIDLPIKFKDDVNDYLFHGSPIQNWYSILSNGLIIPDSDNKLMLNANAYGRGIYLSDSAHYSIGYSQGKTGNSSNLIVGVFQVAKPKKTYIKNTKTQDLLGAHLDC